MVNPNNVDTDRAVIVADLAVCLVKDRKGRAVLSAGGAEPVLLTLADAQELTFWLAQWIREQPVEGETNV